jgi:hypothetical protein
VLPDSGKISPILIGPLGTFEQLLPWALTAPAWAEPDPEDEPELLHALAPRATTANPAMSAALVRAPDLLWYDPMPIIQLLRQKTSSLIFRIKV